MTNAWRIARRELRGGLRGFRVFLACLALGVGAIAAVGAIASSVIGGLERDGAVLLGGDAALRMTYKDISPVERAWLEQSADISRLVYLRSMARVPGNTKQTLVEIKMLDDLYPLYGRLKLSPQKNRANLLSKRNGIWGAVADPALLERLGIKLGETIKLGNATYQVRGIIDEEPDRISGARALQIGPRLMALSKSLPESGLILPGSQVWYFYRVRLLGNDTLKSWKDRLQKAFPDAPWIVRDRTNASPTIKQFINRTTLFMTLVGLTALLVGGVGVGNAVRNFLSSKIKTIATLKCVGASSNLIFGAYLFQVMVMAMAGIFLGLLVGGIAPAILSEIISDVFPFAVRIELYWEPLILATSFGLLTALAFSIWPIAQACDLPATRLFRQSLTGVSGMPRWPFLLATLALLIALAALAIGTAQSTLIAVWFLAGATSTMIILGIAAVIVARTAKAVGSSSGTGLRLALANLHRPGAHTGMVIMSLGLGLTVLVTVTLIEANLESQITRSLPNRAPSYFFIDIQNNQVDDFENAVASVPGFREMRRTPMLRGRVTRLNGQTARPETVSENGRWILRGDRGVTWSRELPEGEFLVAGKWWPTDYSGKPLVSMAKRNAAALGLKIGDTITINILGQNVTAEIASLREVQWGSLRMNFLFIFSPGPLNAAPQTHLATVHADPALEQDIERTIADNFPNVTIIRVRDTLETVSEFLNRLGLATRMTAGVAIVAGILVLAGAIAAGHRRRVYDSIVLKVLGATRRRVIGVLLLEFSLLGFVTAIIASFIGSLAAWGVITEVMSLEFVFDTIAVVISVAAAVASTTALGFYGIWRALGQKSAPLLRNE